MQGKGVGVGVEGAGRVYSRREGRTNLGQSPRPFRRKSYFLCSTFSQAASRFGTRRILECSLNPSCSDVTVTVSACTQRKDAEDEVSELRKAVSDLESRSDDDLLIGQLQRKLTATKVTLGARCPLSPGGDPQAAASVPKRFRTFSVVSRFDCPPSLTAGG